MHNHIRLSLDITESYEENSQRVITERKWSTMKFCQRAKSCMGGQVAIPLVRWFATVRVCSRTSPPKSEENNTPLNWGTVDIPLFCVLFLLKSLTITHFRNLFQMWMLGGWLCACVNERACVRDVECELNVLRLTYINTSPRRRVTHGLSGGAGGGFLGTWIDWLRAFALCAIERWNWPVSISTTLFLIKENDEKLLHTISD